MVLSSRSLLHLHFRLIFLVTICIFVLFSFLCVFFSSFCFLMSPSFMVVSYSPLILTFSFFGSFPSLILCYPVTLSVVHWPRVDFCWPFHFEYSLWCNVIFDVILIWSVVFPYIKIILFHRDVSFPGEVTLKCCPRDFRVLCLLHRVFVSLRRLLYGSG